MSTTELTEGAVVRGKYQILAKLGEGGMGVVYKARHVRFDEVCALKLVSTSLSQDASFLQRFHAEALLMRKLDHPNALRVHDVDEAEDGRPFIVMEYVEGRSLSEILREGTPMAPARAARIAMQACDALAAAHRLGIIHRDIKPPNIMVSQDADGSEHVKVFDFGIAKVKEGSGLRGGASLTQTGMVVGTPTYMSPEQAQGLRGDKLDGRTDLYSLGVVLYEMLTGRTPFAGETPVALLLAHIQQSPPDPRELKGDLPADLVEVIFRALEKNPEKRFADAEEMRDALAAVTLAVTDRTVGVLSPRPGTIPASRAAQRTEVVTPTRPPAAPRVEATERALVTPPAVLAQPAPPEAAPRPAPVTPTPSKPRWMVPVLAVGGAVLALVLFLVFRPGSTPPPSPQPETTVQKPAPAPAPPEKKEPVAPAPAPVTPPAATRTADTPPKTKPAPATSTSDAPEIAKLLKTGAAAFDAGKYDEAIRAYRAALILDPSLAAAKQGLDRAAKAKAAEEAILKKP